MKLRESWLKKYVCMKISSYSCYYHNTNSLFVNHASNNLPWECLPSKHFGVYLFTTYAVLRYCSWLYTFSHQQKQLRPASSPTPEKANSLFSKPVVYHASVCCLSVNKSAHNACSNFIKHDIGHCFKEVSISRSQVGRYLIAIQDSTYFIAFQGEPDFAQWPKKYKSFSEGIYNYSYVQ